MRGDLLVKSRIVVKFADIANIYHLTTATDYNEQGAQVLC